MTTDIRFTARTALSDGPAPDEHRLLVKRAAAELLAEGTPPTAAGIRVRVGTQIGAGVIDEALREWWQELSRRLAATRFRSDAPQPLTDIANEHATSADTHAAATEQREIERQKAVAQEEIRIERERRLTLLQEHIHRVEAQLKQERTAHAALEKQLRRELDELRGVQSKSEAAHKREADAWREEKTKLIKVGQKLHQKVKQAQQQIAAQQEQLADSQAQSASMLEQIQLLRNENTELHDAVTHSLDFEETLREDLTKEITVDPTRSPPRRRR